MLVAHFSKSIDRSTCASFKRPRITIDKGDRKEGRASRAAEKKPAGGWRKRMCACVSFLGDAPTRAGDIPAKDTDKNHTLSALAKHLLNLASVARYIEA